MARISSSVWFGLELIILQCCVQRTVAQCLKPWLSDSTVVLTPDQWQYDNGSVVVFSCNDGGDVYGPTSSLCQSDGQWDYESQPSCKYCERPNFANPYALVLVPDHQTYLSSERVSISCEEGHTSDALPLHTTCQYYQFGSYNWYPDPSNVLCFAQCDTTELLDSDVIAKNANDGRVQTIFVHGESAMFSCQDTKRFTGQNLTTCNNGSFSFNTQPTCLDPCQISLKDLEVKDLSYAIAEDPVINETHTVYYRDGALIMFSCNDGYTPEHCNGVCRDGAWDPPEFPSCNAIGGLTSGTAAGISILTILLVASIVVNIALFIFWGRAKSEKGAEMEPSSYRVTTNGSVQFVTSNHDNHIEKPYTSLRFGPAKSNAPKSDRKRVTFLTKLGSLGMGDFGEAWKGEFRSTQEAVLIRRVPDDKFKSKEILGRVKIFSQLPDHPNVVRCLGYLPDQNIILYKFIPGGTLLTHLQMKRGQSQPRYSAYNLPKPREAPVDEVGLINFAMQIAKGLQFLTSEKIIHGSLCAHNVLLDENKICKISDYGMALSMFDQRVRPSRWNSPETMLDGVYSAEADVWSFGIVMWEIMSLGGRPYPDLDLGDIGKEIANGYKMPRPPHCENELYTIMSRCWEKQSGNRPRIDEIIINLEKILTKTQESLNYLLLNELDNDTYHAYASVD